MVKLPSGLLVIESLTSRQTKLDMDFEPSLGLVAKRIDKLGLDIRSFREPLKRSIQQVIIPSIRQNFDDEGRPDWEPLAPSTVKRRGSDGPILNRSGALRRAATTLKIWTIDTDKAAVLDLPQKVWYGKVHQAGHGGMREFSVKNIATGKMETFTESTDGGIPQRRFIMLQPQDILDIEEIFLDWLEERIQRAGLGGTLSPVGR